MDRFFKCKTLPEYLEYLNWVDVVFIPEVRKKTAGQCHRVIGTNALGHRRYGYAVTTKV